MSQVIWIYDDGVHRDIGKPGAINVRPNGGSACRAIHSLEDVARRTCAAHGAGSETGERGVGNRRVRWIHCNLGYGPRWQGGHNAGPRCSTIGGDFDLPVISARINGTGVAWRRRDGGKRPGRTCSGARTWATRRMCGRGHIRRNRSPGVRAILGLPYATGPEIERLRVPDIQHERRNKGATVRVIDPRIGNETVPKLLAIEGNGNDGEPRHAGHVLTLAVNRARNARINGRESPVAANILRLPDQTT